MPEGFSFRYEAKGFNRVQNKLRKVQSFYATETEKEGRKWMKGNASFFRNKPYPSRSSSYVRTFQLMRKWAAQFLGGVGRWSLINLANARGRYYAQFPVGDSKGQRQAAIHKNIWWVARVELEKRAPILTATLTKKLRRIINS